MEFMATNLPLSFSQNNIDQVKNGSLNPEAPEFYPSSKKASPANCPIFPPTNPFFLRYPILPFLHHPHVFSAPLIFSHPSYAHFYPRQHALLQTHFEKVSAVAYASVAPVSEPGSPLPDPFKAKSTALGEEAQEPRIVARKETMASIRKRCRSNRSRNRKIYGKERVYNLEAGMKEWRAKSRSFCTSDNYKCVAKSVDDQVTSFEYPKLKAVVRGRAGSYKKREKHPPIPLKEDGNETTVMLRNIPNRYTRKMLMDFLDGHCMIANNEADSSNVGADEKPSLSAFDFLYLPIDFATKLNKGYAFVNFTSPESARKFFDVWHSTRWDCVQTNKIKEIHRAKLQGMEKLVKQFERMEFPSEDFQPLIFNPARDGSKQLAKETLVGRLTKSS